MRRFALADLSLSAVDDPVITALDRAVLEYRRASPSIGFGQACCGVAGRLLEQQDRLLAGWASAHSRDVERLEARWGDALDGIELHWLLCRAVAVRHDWEATRHGFPHRPLRIALHQLFWTAHHVGAEVLALLRAGLPAGALARWRPLCELDVRAALIEASDD